MRLDTGAVRPLEHYHPPLGCKLLCLQVQFSGPDQEEMEQWGLQLGGPESCWTETDLERFSRHTQLKSAKSGGEAALLKSLLCPQSTTSAQDG